MSARPPRELVVVGVAATVLTLVGAAAANAAVAPDDDGGPSTTTTSSSITTTSSSTTTTAAPTTTTTAAPAPVDPVEAAIHRWFPDMEERASAIAFCESTFNPRAVSPGGSSHGLFQIHNVHRPDFVAVTGMSWAEGRYDPNANAQFARWLYDRQGWEPWACA
jgi:hypothetical protein